MFGFIKRLLRKKKEMYFVEFKSNGKNVKIELSSKQNLFELIYIDEYIIKIIDLEVIYLHDGTIIYYKAIDYTF